MLPPSNFLGVRRFWIIWTIGNGVATVVAAVTEFLGQLLALIVMSQLPLPERGLHHAVLALIVAVGALIFFLTFVPSPGAQSPTVAPARPPDPNPLWIAAVGAVVLVGIAQWFVLRRQVRGSGWWILASATGVALGMALASTLGSGGRSVLLPARLLVLGLTYGAVTGFALTGLLPDPTAQAVLESSDRETV